MWEMGAEDKFTCQECCSRSMIRIEKRRAGTYMLKCEECGIQLGPLPLKNSDNLIW